MEKQKTMLKRRDIREAALRKLAALGPDADLSKQNAQYRLWIKRIWDSAAAEDSKGSRDINWKNPANLDFDHPANDVFNIRNHLWAKSHIAERLLNSDLTFVDKEEEKRYRALYYAYEPT